MYVEHENSRIHVCCKGCIAKIEADPATYVKKIHEAGEVLYSAGKGEEEDKHEGHDHHKH